MYKQIAKLFTPDLYPVVVGFLLNEKTGNVRIFLKGRTEAMLIKNNGGYYLKDYPHRITNSEELKKAVNNFLRKKEL